MNTKVKQLGPQFSTWTCDHSRVKPWCLSHKYGCLSHKYGIGHRMDDLSYFREEREWAVREDDNSRKKKARWGGRAWRELLFPCSQSHFDCWSIETLKNWFGPYWDCLLLLLGQTTRVDSKHTWNGKTAAPTLNAFGLKQKIFGAIDAAHLDGHYSSESGMFEVAKHGIVAEGMTSLNIIVTSFRMVAL